MGKVTASAMANDGEIDIVPFYAVLQPTLASQNVYVNLLDDVPYINLEQPWWYQELIDHCTINDKLYLITGEIGISTIAMMSAIAFNRNLADEYLKDVDLYQTVRDGKWTLDTLLNYARDVYHDVNGNTKADEEDIFGFDVGRGEPLIYASNVTLSRIENGFPVLAANNERMITLVEKIQPFYKTNGYAPSSLKYPDSSCFAEGHVLFSHRYVRDIASLREMEDDYGVLPLPKLDEAQDAYYTSLGESYSQVAIMVSTDALEASAAAIELMAAEAYRSVTYVYYENVLKVKYARDDNTAEMLDILLNGITTNFIDVYSQMLGQPMVALRDVVMSADKEFSSTYASIEESTNLKIKALFESME